MREGYTMPNIFNTPGLLKNNNTYKDLRNWTQLLANVKKGMLLGSLKSSLLCICQEFQSDKKVTKVCPQKIKLKEVRM